MRSDVILCRLRALPVLLLLLEAPAAGLDTIWLVRHAEKADAVPQLLVALGATPECYAKLGSRRRPTAC